MEQAGRGERAVVRGGGNEVSANVPLIHVDYGSEPLHYR